MIFMVLLASDGSAKAFPSSAPSKAWMPYHDEPGTLETGGAVVHKFPNEGTRVWLEAPSMQAAISNAQMLVKDAGH